MDLRLGNTVDEAITVSFPTRQSQMICASCYQQLIAVALTTLCSLPSCSYRPVFLVYFHFGPFVDVHVLGESSCFSSAVVVYGGGAVYKIASTRQR